MKSHNVFACCFAVVMALAVGSLHAGCPCTAKKDLKNPAKQAPQKDGAKRPTK